MPRFSIRFTYKIFTSFCLILFSSSSATSQAQPLPVPVASFFKGAQFSDAKFSPDGKSLAMLMMGKNERMVLGVLEVGKLLPEIIANYEDKDVRSFHWVNNHRLVYDLTDRNFKEVQRFFGPGLYAVNTDRTKRTRLVTHEYTGRNHTVEGAASPWYTAFFDVIHNQESADIYVVQSVEAGSNIYDLYRMNTLTGNTQLVERPGKVGKWLIDKQGVPRIAQVVEGPASILYYKDPKTDAWRKLATSTWTSRDNIDPLFISPEGDLYVRANNGKDTRSLYRFDLEKNLLDPEPVISLNGYDFDGQLIYNTLQKKVLGLHYEMGSPATVWFDEKLIQQQKKIDELLPFTVNRISVPEDGVNNNLLVHSSSDVDPGTWQLYNLESGKFTRLGSSQPEINPVQMSSKEMLRYKARDGLEIPAYLTLPVNGKGKNLPLVVLVHGGPYARGGHWKWDPQVQFLASRGYAVLEPDFRGSVGYGHKHFSAAMKQWGLAMQDDIADGAQWAIKQGYADANRICIAGASYGGYSTLMGLIRDPQIFKCGFEWVGVTDINFLFDKWSDISDEWKWYGMPMLIGDQDKDAAQLKATSPLENAARLKQPLLMAYGGFDRRVPIAHGTKFYDAVKRTNPNVEWIEYPEEGHGFRLLKNNVDFWTRVEKFLDQNIGLRSPTSIHFRE